jgi:hypothetical protein
MLRAWIWPLFRDQNGPNGAFWVPSKANIRVPPGRFRQSQKLDSQKLISEPPHSTGASPSFEVYRLPWAYTFDHKMWEGRIKLRKPGWSAGANDSWSVSESWQDNWAGSRYP